MKSFITAAEKTALCILWAIVFLLRIVLLPLHMISYTLWKGCDESARVIGEWNEATIQRIKSE